MTIYHFCWPGGEIYYDIALKLTSFLHETSRKVLKKEGLNVNGTLAVVTSHWWRCIQSVPSSSNAPHFFLYRNGFKIWNVPFERWSCGYQDIIHLCISGNYRKAYNKYQYSPTLISYIMSHHFPLLHQKLLSVFIRSAGRGNRLYGAVINSAWLLAPETEKDTVQK